DLLSHQAVAQAGRRSGFGGIDLENGRGGRGLSEGARGEEGGQNRRNCTRFHLHGIVRSVALVSADYKRQGLPWTHGPQGKKDRDFSGPDVPGDGSLVPVVPLPGSRSQGIDGRRYGGRDVSQQAWL